MLKLFLFILITSFLNTEEITLEDAINLALNKNLEIKQKELEEDLSKQDRWNNYTNLLPSLKYEGKYLNDNQEFTNSFPFVHDLKFSVSDILYNFKTIKKYDLAVEIKKNELKAAKLNLKAKVIDIFTSLLKIEREIKISKIYLDKAFKDLELFNQLYSQGNSSKFEIIKLETNIVQIKSKLFELENSREELTNNFILLTGKTNFTLKAFNLEGIEYSSLEIKESKAIENSIIIKNLALEYNRYQHPFTSLLPKIDFSLAYKIEMDNDFFRNWEQESKKFSFTLSIDLFKWGQSFYDFNIKQKALNLEVAKAEEEETRLKENLKIRKSFLVRAKELLEFKKEFLKKLKEKSLVMQEKTLKGLSSADELFKVNQEAYDQELNILDFEYKIFKKFEEFKLMLQGAKI